MGVCKPEQATGYEFYISKDGDLYIKALKDITIQGALFTIMGFFKTGPEAESLMDSGSQSVIPYKLSSDSQVLVQPKPGTTQPKWLQQCSPEQPCSLQSLFEAASHEGQPRPEIHMHTVEQKVEGTAVTFEVSSTQKACLKPTITEPTEGKDSRFPPEQIPMKSLSGYVDLNNLTKTKVVFMLQYDDQANKFKGMHPRICLDQTYKLAEGVIAKI